MLIIFIRSIIIYLALLINMRLMGKRQLGELQPFEFAITLLIADLATIPMQDTAIPILHGLIPIFAIFIVHLFISMLNFKSTTLRKIIDGKPSVIVDDNGIDYKEMKSLNMHVNDLMEGLRQQGYFSLSDVHIAIVETNGALSVMPKFSSSPVTNSDMDIKGENPQLPYSLVLEGNVMKDTLEKFGKVDKNYVLSELDKHGLKEKDVYLFSVCENGNYYLQPYKKKAIIGRLEL